MQRDYSWGSRLDDELAERREIAERLSDIERRVEALRQSEIETLRVTYGASAVGVALAMKTEQDFCATLRQRVSVSAGFSELQQRVRDGAFSYPPRKRPRWGLHRVAAIRNCVHPASGCAFKQLGQGTTLLRTLREDVFFELEGFIQSLAGNDLLARADKLFLSLTEDCKRPPGTDAEFI